eukprot:sb/3478816/
MENKKEETDSQTLETEKEIIRRLMEEDTETEATWGPLGDLHDSLACVSVESGIQEKDVDLVGQIKKLKNKRFGNMYALFSVQLVPTPIIMMPRTVTPAL